MQSAARIADLTVSRQSRPASRVTRFFRTRWDAFKERRERARVRAILYGMHDRELKDLGFTRSEIESVMVDSSGERVRAYPKPNPLRR